MDRVTHDDVGSADEAGDESLDLSPRTPSGGAPRRSGGGAKWVWGGLLVAIVVAIGFVITQGLTQATLFYRNADEAVARRSEDFGTTFRLQGIVVEGSRQTAGDGVDFKVEFNDTTVDVHHKGAPPELFQDCIPIVVEGRWSAADDPATFNSTEMIVKHDENYEAANSDRIAQARAEGASGDNACVMRAAGVGRS